MAYDRAMDIMRLAIRLQGTGAGLTLDDIEREFEVSRRTAERLRNAVEELFGPLETVNTGEAKRRCRLRAPNLRRLVSLSAEELAELSAAATALERAGLEERAAMLRTLDDKLRAVLEAEALSGIEPDLQALTEAEGLALRPGPQHRLEDGLLAVLRQAIKTGRIVAFDYASRATGQRTRRRVEPYGLIYGNRAFLVGRAQGGAEMRLWRLARIGAAEVTGEPFTRDPAFDLQRFTRRSFGTFQEEPVGVVLRFDNLKSEQGKTIFHRAAQDLRRGGRELRPGGYWIAWASRGRRFRRSIRAPSTPPSRDLVPTARTRISKAYEPIAQAMGGSMSTTGLADGPRCAPGSQVGDSGSGIHMVAAILAALFQRTHTGRGQRVEVAMQDSVLNLVRVKMRDHQRLQRGPLPEYPIEHFDDAVPRSGNASGGGHPGTALRCKPGGPNDYIYVVFQPQIWDALLRTMGREDLIDDERFTLRRRACSASMRCTPWWNRGA